MGNEIRRGNRWRRFVTAACEAMERSHRGSGCSPPLAGLACDAVVVHPNQPLTGAVTVDFAVGDHLPDGNGMHVEVVGSVVDAGVAAPDGLAVDHGQACEGFVSWAWVRRPFKRSVGRIVFPVLVIWFLFYLGPLPAAHPRLRCLAV